LNLLTLHVPPLRERTDEIEPLAWQFLRAADSGVFSNAQTFSSDALSALRGYAWPGNVRELRNVIERAALLCEGPELTEDALPERMRAGAAGHAASPSPDDKPRAGTGHFAALVRSYETRLILEALDAAAGNQTKAAEQLGMPLRTLVYKLRSYGLRPSTTSE
jgi:DNA-binding NtrC family response regulator